MLQLEKLVEELQVEVFPVTIGKFLLNRRKISRALQDPRYIINIDPKECSDCTPERECRKHNCIRRITKEVKKCLVFTEPNLFPKKIYFFKNEIYLYEDGLWRVVYCPHTKLIQGKLTDSKIRKITTFGFRGDPPAEPVEEVQFNFLHLLTQKISFWFNNQFTLVLVPNNMERSDWYLTI
jgi:hypothetical protein